MDRDSGTAKPCSSGRPRETNTYAKPETTVQQFEKAWLAKFADSVVQPIGKWNVLDLADVRRTDTTRDDQRWPDNGMRERVLATGKAANSETYDLSKP